MNALGYQFPVGGGIVLGTYERGLSRVSSFRGHRLPRRNGTRLNKRQRPLSAWRILAATQPVETSAARFDSSGAGTQEASLQELEIRENERASESQKFNWNTQWYPVAVIDDLDENAPAAATVLGQSLAVWWDRSSSKWQVYADQCPHRLAPLSEGSISEDGHLRCSYHGWTFKGDAGECTYIPQAPKDNRQAHTSKRACVSVYPSRVQQGFLWFWPDLSQGPINVEAAANPPPIFSQFDDPTFKYRSSSRDVQYGYETLIENVMDPAHVNFAHHKIQGNRKSAKPLNYRITTEITPAGFEGGDAVSKAVFHAPCCFALHFTVGGESQYVAGTSLKTKQEGDTKGKRSREKPPMKVSLIFFCVPISPGRSRLFWSFPRNFATFLVTITPAWVAHMTNNLVLDSDMYLLHLMERKLEQEGSRNWFKRYYLATTADTYVRGLRKWLNDFAGGAPD